MPNDPKDPYTQNIPQPVVPGADAPQGPKPPPAYSKEELLAMDDSGFEAYAKQVRDWKAHTAAEHAAALASEANAVKAQVAAERAAKELKIKQLRFNRMTGAGILAGTAGLLGGVYGGKKLWDYYHPQPQQPLPPMPPVPEAQDTETFAMPQAQDTEYGFEQPKQASDLGLPPRLNNALTAINSLVESPPDFVSPESEPNNLAQYDLDFMPNIAARDALVQQLLSADKPFDGSASMEQPKQAAESKKTSKIPEWWPKWLVDHKDRDKDDPGYRPQSKHKASKMLGHMLLTNMAIDTFGIPTGTALAIGAPAVSALSKGMNKKEANWFGDVGRRIAGRSPEYIQQRNAINSLGKLKAEQDALTALAKRRGVPQGHPDLPSGVGGVNPEPEQSFLQKNKWPLIGAGGLGAGYLAYQNGLIGGSQGGQFMQPKFSHDLNKEARAPRWVRHALRNTGRAVEDAVESTKDMARNVGNAVTHAVTHGAHKAKKGIQRVLEKDSSEQGYEAMLVRLGILKEAAPAPPAAAIAASFKKGPNLLKKGLPPAATSAPKKDPKADFDYVQRTMGFGKNSSDILKEAAFNAGYEDALVTLGLRKAAAVAKAVAKGVQKGVKAVTGKAAPAVAAAPTPNVSPTAFFHGSPNVPAATPVSSRAPGMLPANPNKTMPTLQERAPALHQQRTQRIEAEKVRNPEKHQRGFQHTPESKPVAAPPPATPKPQAAPQPQKQRAAGAQTQPPPVAAPTSTRLPRDSFPQPTVQAPPAKAPAAVPPAVPPAAKPAPAAAPGAAPAAAGAPAQPGAFRQGFDKMREGFGQMPAGARYGILGGGAGLAGLGAGAAIGSAMQPDVNVIH